MGKHLLNLALRFLLELTALAIFAFWGRKHTPLLNKDNAFPWESFYSWEEF